jgi:hypothetical protein
MVNDDSVANAILIAATPGFAVLRLIGSDSEFYIERYPIIAWCFEAGDPDSFVPVVLPLGKVTISGGCAYDFTDGGASVAYGISSLDMETRIGQAWAIRFGKWSSG